MVKKDIDAQWLAGDELKQDQFKFMYSVMKIIYDSALRDAMLNDKKEVIEGVLPALVAYQALLVIKRILDVKEAEAKKEKEKMEREGITSKRDMKPVEEPQPVLVQEPVKLNATAAKKGTMAPVMEMKSEAELAREAEREEIKKYGVSYTNLLLILLMDYRGCGSGSNTSMMKRKKLL